jgi:quercetin dioxygenase-like cupin family protein
MNFEKYNLSQGSIMIAFSDKNLSIGILEINPNRELTKHNRPVLESLYQISGSCLMKIFSDNGEISEKILKVGDTLDIEPNKYHMHSNPFAEKSITLWKASGDITEIIENIRKSSEL